MIAKLAFILCGSLQLAVLCSAVPLERRTVEAAMQPPARFDAGPVNSCEIPATNFCSVDYSVPTSVARSLTLIIEEEIRNQYELDKAANGLECAQALRDIRCAQRFPRCSADNTQVTVSSLNCTKMISVCPGNIQMMLQAEGFCTLGSTSVIGECKPVTEYGYQFLQCPMGSSDNWYVTRWMHDIMVHADVQLAARFNGTLSSINTECRSKYATYLCQFMGRCTSHVEPRVEVVNTYEMCEEVINCFPDWLTPTFRAILPCSQWPNQHGPVSIPPPSSPPVVTHLTTEPPSGSSDDNTLRTTATMKSTWPNPTFILGKDKFVTGAASFHSVCIWTLLLLTILAILGSL